MMEDNFYIVIPSNTPSFTDTPNYASNFKIQLPKSLELDKSKWEVALVQINFPISWHVVSGRKYYVNFYREPFHTHEAVEQKSRRIPKGNYYLIQDLIDALNDLKDDEIKSFFKMTKTGKASLVLAPFEYVSLSPSLASLLGFSNVQKADKSNIPKSLCNNQDFFFRHNQINPLANEYTPNQIFTALDYSSLNGSVYNIYVYCNIVEPTLVGNDYVPLIDTIGIGDMGSKYVSLKYETPHYLKLLTGHIQNIEIQLCDDTGESLRFKWGRVVVKLHFRKRKWEK